MIKIIIVDDHALFRQGIRALIEIDNLGEVIAEANNGQVFLDLLKTNQPDLVMMDIEMPVMNGYDAIIKAKIIQPEIRILVLTMLSEKDKFHEMINAGAMGYLLKSSGKDELDKAIRTVMKGEIYLSNELIRQIVLDMDSNTNLENNKQVQKSISMSVREKEVLIQFCQGLTVNEIAEKLFISPKTVEAHRSTLIKKTNTKNTINLILHALKYNLVSL